MAKRISKKDLNKVILIVAAGYQRLFEEGSIEIKFSKEDSILLDIILFEEFDKVMGNSVVCPELNNLPEHLRNALLDEMQLPDNLREVVDNSYHLPEPTKTIMAQGITILKMKIQNAYNLSTTVEIDRDDFQILSFVIQSRLDNLCKDHPDLVECLAQMAKIFMGIDEFDEQELKQWLSIQATSQYLELKQ